MTGLSEQTGEAARALPPDMRDEIARLVLQLAGTDDEPSVGLSPDERSAIERSKAAAARGEFATDADIRRVWTKHRL
jgi:hypothetical protein